MVRSGTRSEIGNARLGEHYDTLSTNVQFIPFMNLLDAQMMMTIDITCIYNEVGILGPANLRYKGAARVSSDCNRKLRLDIKVTFFRC